MKFPERNASLIEYWGVYGKEKKKQITVFIDNVYVRHSFIDFFF